MQKKIIVRAVAACAAVMLTACGTVQVQPLSSADLAAQTTLDRQTAMDNVPPVSGALSMDEAIARALKYNLERRTRLMEEALAMNQFDNASCDMLPRLMANAG